MYQMSQPPHLYLHVSNPRAGNPNELLFYRRMTDGTVHYFNKSVFAETNGFDGRHHREIPPIEFRASRRTARSVRGGDGNRTTPECESDDSSVSSVTSNSINNNDNNEKDAKIAANGVHAPNPHAAVANQQTLSFQNRRRNHATRGPQQGRIMSVRYHYANPPPVHVYNIAPDRFMMKAHLTQVRDTPKNLLTGSMWDTLSRDIWNKFMECQQTEDTFKKKMRLWKFLYVSVKSMSPRYGLYLVGSTMSGFGSNNSDMDLCLLVKHQEPGDSRFQALQHLNTIYHFIKNMDVFVRVELIQAKVPILKFQDTCFFLEVDLNCNNVVGIRNTHLLHCYSQLDWRVRPLVLVVKIWAQYNNINDAKNKTISSYSLVLMVIHYLQCGTQPGVLPCLQKELPEKFSNSSSIHNIDIHEHIGPYKSENNQSLGELFYGFLQYYTYFEYSKYAISVRTGKLISVEECRAAHRHEPHQWKYLCVEEPFDLSNTARSVYDPDVFTHICGIFERSKRALEKSPVLSSLLPSHQVH